MPNYLLREALSKRWWKGTTWTRFPGRACQFTSKRAAQDFSDEHNLGAIPVSLGSVDEIQFARLICDLDELGVFTRELMDRLEEERPIRKDQAVTIIQKAQDTFGRVVGRIRSSDESEEGE